jgi:cephalosporin-C deacetylase
MPFLDMPLDELRSYRPDVAEPADFDEFWRGTLEDARAAGGQTELTPIETGLTAIDTFDVTFPGFGGEPVRAWFSVPAGASGPLPTIVAFNGYGGGRGLPHERIQWPAAGYAYLLMDTRGQGSGWGTGGSTADPSAGQPAAPGFMTRGILDPREYYYRRVYTDAVRAVDAARGLDLVDPTRIAVAGGSQGGGMAIAVAGLVPNLAAVMPDVPFLSHFRRAVGFTARDPYAEIVRYLSVHREAEAKVFETLSYFDGVTFAKRASAPALYSVALMDETCPPSTVFASYNSYGGDADIEVYPFNDHEGGGDFQWTRQVRWLAARMAR